MRARNSEKAINELASNKDARQQQRSISYCLRSFLTRTLQAHTLGLRGGHSKGCPPYLCVQRTFSPSFVYNFLSF
ncbi:hypothetical protein HMPREF3190_00720 [Umbribacter vaginalis]|nr:hypothetical protein HMPREF3190_00720 [Coriobacteriales bacterium DNF00809]